MKRIPAVSTIMTPFPYSVDAHAPLNEARDLMQAHAIHHLPVTDGETLVGVVHSRDLEMPHGAAVEVSDLPYSNPVIAEMHERLDVSLERLVGAPQSRAILVTRQGKLVGIVTVSDVCRELADRLRQPFLTGGGDDAA